ncbi:hypothetical protein THRCLA_21768 [Thraustotheca clavata]|uniref:Uncharacterized protein n=1 Tax=Thraustotheca clavata TaxID=74557 RepID=A0A1V9ZPV3_9STRA|nr:hypothetical protein THRCLA_21768 [Thraustotheca clavata]
MARERQENYQVDSPMINPLHEKFDSWLASTFQSPIRKPKSKRQSRLLRPLLGHASSLPALQANEPNIIDDTNNRIKRVLPSIESIQVNRFNTLRQEASYGLWTYLRSSIRPGLAFTPQFSSLSSTQVNIPVTFIREEQGIYRLVYSNSEHMIKTHVYPSKSAVEQDTTRIVRLLVRRPSRFCAVVKIFEPATQTNKLELLETKQEVLRAIKALLLATSGVFGIQEFIPSKSQKLSMLVRCAWHNNKSTNNIAWVLTDSVHSIVNTHDAQACRIDKVVSSSSWGKPRELTQGLANDLTIATSLKFQSLVADFVQDDEGSWWCLQVKAFRLSETKLPATPPPPALLMKCPGHLCEPNVQNDKMTNTILYKDILYGNFVAQNTDHPVIQEAYDAYSKQLSRKVRNQLYNRVNVCTNCYYRYMQFQQEKDKVVRNEKTIDDLLVSMESMISPLPESSTVVENPKVLEPENSTLPETIENPIEATELAQCFEFNNEEASKTNQLECEQSTPREALSMKNFENSNLTVPPEIIENELRDKPNLQFLPEINENEPRDKPNIQVLSEIIANDQPKEKSSVNVVDAFWHQFQPKISIQEPKQTPIQNPQSVVVLPKHYMTIQAKTIFFDDQYKQSILLEIQTMMNDFHTVIVSADEEENALIALQSLFLELQDNCIEGMYGLDGISTNSSNGKLQLTLTPHLATK